ncbi:hypothetical protein NQZ68_036351 [Dissostichus eleginoides]|nr:hypothetical protein NQZ68_036351 [Dissostichus eleginoides]
MDEFVDMKRNGGHVAAATLEPQSSVSVAESPRPSICPCALNETFVPPSSPQWVIQNTHKQTDKDREKHTLF